MTKIILAALTVLSLGAGVANAQSYSHGMPPAHSYTGPTTAGN
jgi:hypothetical protein